MTNDDLCPVCAHELIEHKSGIPCCPYCKSDNWINYSVVYKCKTCGSETPPQNDGRNDDHVDWVTRDHAKEAACTRAHPSPWLNAPIPEYGCVQQLVIMEDGSWGIQYIEEYDKGVTKFCFTGVNGGPARTERRTMINGKLVYEEEK